LGIVAVSLEQLIQRVVQLANIFRDAVGEVAVLRLTPDVFHRVELRRVTGEPFDTQPVAPGLAQLPGGGPMGRQAVADQQQRAAQMMVHVLQEANHVGCVSVMVPEIVVQAETTRPRSATERCNGGDPIMPIPSVLDRRVAARGPHPTPQRLQQEAALSEKNQASLPLSALFLVAASARSASERSPLRDVREPVAPASADSNPVGAAACRRNRGGNRPRTTARSDPEPKDQSNPLARSPNARGRAATRSATPGAATAPALARDQDAAWPLTSVRRRAARLASSDWPTTNWNPPRQPLPPAISLAQKAGLPHVGELPAPREFLWVSYHIIRSRPLGFH